MGRKKMPFYRIVVMDSRTRRDGRYLDKLGYYNPLTKPETIVLDKDKVYEWLRKGAEPTDTVFNILQKQGIALEWHLQKNYLDEKARNIERQKWELAKKARGAEEVNESEKEPESEKPTVEIIEAVEDYKSESNQEEQEENAPETSEENKS